MIMDGPLGAHSSSARQMPSIVNMDISFPSVVSGGGTKLKATRFRLQFAGQDPQKSKSRFGLLFTFDMLRERPVVDHGSGSGCAAQPQVS
jgi:hypothetical protein